MAEPTKPEDVEALESFDLQEIVEAIEAVSTSPEQPRKPLSLEEVVDVVTTTLKHGVNYKTMAVVREALESYESSWNEWKRFEFWDEKKKYTRNLIATDGSTFTLMLLCWNPGRASPIHDHMGSQCFMRTISGKIVESQYENPCKKKLGEQKESKSCEQACLKALIPRSERVFESGKVIFINDHVGLHKIENPYEERAVTLHCYIPPYKSCHCFCPVTGDTNVGHMVFDTENGERVGSEH